MPQCKPRLITVSAPRKGRAKAKVAFPLRNCCSRSSGRKKCRPTPGEGEVRLSMRRLPMERRRRSQPRGDVQLSGFPDIRPCRFKRWECGRRRTAPGPLSHDARSDFEWIDTRQRPPEQKSHQRPCPAFTALARPFVALRVCVAHQLARWTPRR
jgi:hypothetical protein